MSSAVVAFDGAGYFPSMPRRQTTTRGRPHAEVGERLRLMMEARGLTSAQVARLLGMSPTRYSNYVVGSSLIPVDAALKLRVYGVSLEWLYSGDIGYHLHPDFVAALTRVSPPNRSASTALHPRR